MMFRHPDGTARRRAESGETTPPGVAGATLVRVVDQIEIVADRADDVVTHFTSKARLLPTFARTYTSHEAAARGMANDPLSRAIRSLEGKFVVANRACAATLPAPVRDVVADVHALCRRSAASSHISVALDEPRSVVIHHAPASGASKEASSPAPFSALLPYQLTIGISIDSPATSRRLIEAARPLFEPLAGEGIDWFNAGLCIPDGEAIQQMTGDAALFYRDITGRLGAGTPERYWHLDAWEQYTEPGRMHGFVVPEFLRLPQYSTSAIPSDEEGVDAVAPYGSSLWPPLTKTLVKRALIPPGYCFVEYYARVSVLVRGADGDGLGGGPR